MNRRLTHKILNVPVIIWLAQLVYTACSLLVLIGLLIILDASSIPPSTAKTISIGFVGVILLVDIVWRLRIAKKHPEWF